MRPVVVVGAVMQRSTVLRRDGRRLPVLQRSPPRSCRCCRRPNDTPPQQQRLPGDVALQLQRGTGRPSNAPSQQRRPTAMFHCSSTAAPGDQTVLHRSTCDHRRCFIAAPPRQRLRCKRPPATSLAGSMMTSAVFVCLAKDGAGRQVYCDVRDELTALIKRI